MKKLIVFLLIAISPPLAAQESAAPLEKGLPAGRSMRPSKEVQPPRQYADSNEFNKAFKEFYPIVQPKVTMQERFEKLFKQQSRSFAKQGVDSARAYEAASKALDPNFDREHIFNSYRAQLTAEELKTLTQFFKTSAGQKFLTSGAKLLAANGLEIEQQLRRVVTTAIAPLRKPVARPVRDGVAPARSRTAPAPNAAPAPSSVPETKDGLSN